MVDELGNVGGKIEKDGAMLKITKGREREIQEEIVIRENLHHAHPVLIFVNNKWLSFRNKRDIG